MYRSQLFWTSQCVNPSLYTWTIRKGRITRKIILSFSNMWCEFNKKTSWTTSTSAYGQLHTLQYSNIDYQNGGTDLDDDMDDRIRRDKNLGWILMLLSYRKSMDFSGQPTYTVLRIFCLRSFYV